VVPGRHNVTTSQYSVSQSNSNVLISRPGFPDCSGSNLDIQRQQIGRVLWICQNDRADRQSESCYASSARPGSHSSGSNGSGGSGSIPLARVTPTTEPITEEDEPDSAPQRPHWLQTPSSQRFAASSPGQLTPQDIDSESDDFERVRRGERKTESPQPVGMGSLDKRNAGLSPSHLQRAHTLSPDAIPASHHAEDKIQSFFDIPIPQASREDEASKQEALGGSSRPASLDKFGVLRKDTVLTPGEKAEREEETHAAEAAPQDGFAPEDWGQAFRIEWIRAGNLPFHRIRNLRNPWNADREVKVSRDGTEIEPGKTFPPDRTIDTPANASRYSGVATVRMGSHGSQQCHAHLSGIPMSVSHPIYKTPLIHSTCRLAYTLYPASQTRACNPTVYPFIALEVCIIHDSCTLA
jgi:hypothetical protein